mmetsp:Transcript_59538/g.128822  ORF Transcript_59538/g.128822 Transcript_59538/m.128822 type:complete len:264 (-) Transcript_59538:125-916(-)
MVPANTWGQKGVEAGRPDEEMDEKVSFEVKLTFIVAVLFFYPVSLCMILHSKMTVQYWFGHGALWAAFAVPLWILITHILIARGVLRRGLAAIVVIIMPAAFLASVCQVQAWQFTERAGALVSQDCTSFLGKAKLQRSWVAAQALKNSCTENLVNMTGADPYETAEIITFEDCPGYFEGKLQFGDDWTYLQHLEKNYHCGGWCTAELPLWVPQANTQDSCSLAVARSMGGNISLLGVQVTVYSGILLFSSSLLLLFSPKTLGA